MMHAEGARLNPSLRISFGEHRKGLDFQSTDLRNALKRFRKMGPVKQGNDASLVERVGLPRLQGRPNSHSVAAAQTALAGLVATASAAKVT